MIEPALDRRPVLGCAVLGRVILGPAVLGRRPYVGREAEAVYPLRYEVLDEDA